MTGKERAEWRKRANTLSASFQIGKDGISGELTSAVGDYLNKWELVKLSVLPTCALSAREAAAGLSEALGAEIIQCIGRKLVLYREKEEQHA